MAVQIIIRNPLDRDARDYMARAGVTDGAARTQINEFCRGTKSIGIWNSMVCWPLRSAQNLPTDTTMLSLGGLGTYNGTMVNSPVRGADGMAFDSALGQRVTTNFVTPANAEYTMMAVAKYVSPKSTYAAALSMGLSKGTSLWCKNDLKTAMGGWRYDRVDFTNSVARVDTGSGFLCASAAGTSTGWTSRINGAPLTTLTSDFRLSDIGGKATIGAHMKSDLVSFQEPWDGQIAFGLIATQAVSSDIQLTLYNLYKATLGAGLGLP